MIRIETIDPEPLSALRYLNARSGGGSEVSRLEFSIAHVGPLADELDAIVCCSDLQGMVAGELLGVAVADHLEPLVATPARTGIVLAGDLYSVPAANKRGGFGDVASVWQAFADRFAWVVGVAGNHDDVSNVEGDNVHVLDGSTVVIDGLRFGGVGGVIGNPNKPGRRDEAAHLDALLDVIRAEPDVLVLHEGPHGDDAQPGNADIRAAIEAGKTAFTVCGHVHWHEPLAELERGQIINVDARVLILRAGPLR